MEEEHLGSEWIRDRFHFLPGGMLYIKDLQTLVFADVHIGLEFALAEEEGLFIPPIQYDRIKSLIVEAVRSTKPRRIIILGDLKHKFERRTPQEHREVSDLLESVHNLGKELVLIRGNHDTYISGFLERFGVKVFDYLVIDDLIFVHGHKPIPEGIITDDKFLIMAHIHPVVVVSNGISRYRFKCFLLGKHSLILPAVTPLLPGFDIVGGVVDSADYGSPLLEANLDAYKVILVSEAGRILNFGSVARLRSQLR